MPQVRRTWGRAESREKPQVCAVRTGRYMFCKYENALNAWPNALRVMPFSSMFADAFSPKTSGPFPRQSDLLLTAGTRKFTIASHRLAAGGMHLGCDVCTWGSEGGGDAPGGAHLGL